MLKDKVRAHIEENQKHLIEISDEIHANPEVANEEVKASRLLAEELEKAGFKVDLGVAGLDTAILAVHPDQSDGPTIAILGEYDALPVIGHACGHNLIAASALGACLSLGSMKKDIPGKLVFMGTPAEEAIGGKIAMVEKGLFKDVDAALMFHASGTPEKGINALDAVIQTFNGINALRQHIKSAARIHGVITHGGLKPNIVPDYAAAEFYVRAPTDSYCSELVKKVEKCAIGAASATGATLKYTVVEPSYQSRIMNKTMGNLFEKNLTAIGEPLISLPPGSGAGSSDIGNVSQVVPTIHPYISICDDSIAGHSIEFEKASSSERGNEAMLNAAKALAMTAIDLFTDSKLMKQATEEFQNKKK